MKPKEDPRWNGSRSLDDARQANGTTRSDIKFGSTDDGCHSSCIIKDNIYKGMKMNNKGSVKVIETVTDTYTKTHNEKGTGSSSPSDYC